MVFFWEITVENVFQTATFDYFTEIFHACREFFFNLIPKFGINTLGIKNYTI